MICIPGGFIWVKQLFMRIVFSLLIFFCVYRIYSSFVRKKCHNVTKALSIVHFFKYKIELN